jgi:hypothetical protein
LRAAFADSSRRVAENPPPENRPGAEFPQEQAEFVGLTLSLAA